jgi:3'(2'), 5'-bisphosphate nucleotidase
MRVIYRHQSWGRNTMNRQDHRRLTDQLLPTVLAAARLEMGYFRAGCAVETKADQSPVTIADQEAEAMILDTLSKIMPDVPVVAEEAFAAGARPLLSDVFLLVDALDGTKQFVSGFAEFTINIAVVAGGRPIYGLVYAPALRDLLVTDGAQSALRASIDPSSDVATLDAAAATAIQVSPRFGQLVGLQSRSRNLALTDEFLSEFPVAEKRQLGSSYKFCLIAAGLADLYPQMGETREWDTAAGEAVLVAAGGCVATLDGVELAYGNSRTDYLNPAFVASSAPLSRLRKPGLALSAG